MRFFSKMEKVLPKGQERLAAKIAGRILRFQRQLADRLNILTAGFSLWLWRVMLVAFCLLFGGYSLYLVVAAIN